MSSFEKLSKVLLTICFLAPLFACAKNTSVPDNSSAFIPDNDSEPDVPNDDEDDTFVPVDDDDEPAIDSGKEYEFDVVVYGGTASGFVSAIAAKRNGAKSVAYISATDNLGGLTTSGLGATDMMNYRVIGGIAREFYQRIYTYYDTDDTSIWFTEQNRDQYFNETNLANGKIFYGKNEDTKMQWVFEPHVSSMIVAQMLEEAEVTVIKKTPISLKNGVVMNEDTKEVSKIRMTNGDLYKAKVFIDASYEGDLMAQAGVTYTYGRESNEQYNEQFNGVFRNDEATVNIAGNHTSPYIIPGDKNSGLLPFIEDSCPGDVGSPDSRIQAYTYRFTLSSDKENQLPITKSENYHPEWFEIFGRQYTSGYLSANPLTFNLMPNLKTDTNQADFVGASHNYPEGSYKQRAKIEKMHKDYCLDYIYFLANDSRVSQVTKQEMNKWGLALDEFLDSDNFPTAIYLREGRRMVSDYVMTEMNVINEDRKIDAPYSIGQGMYNCDSHWVSRFVNDAGTGYLEEGSYWKSKRNYPISYKSICPKKGETTNLFVTSCLSATHAAYGSIRMEPVYMVIGESAGTAAALIAASLSKISTQDLNYNVLKDRLVTNKQLLGTVVIPEGDDPGTIPDLPPEKEQTISIVHSGFTPIGTLKNSSNYTFEENPIKLASQVGTGGRFTPNIFDTKYKVFVYNQFASTTYDDPTYKVDVYHNDNTVDTFILDAANSANKQFVSIGEYSNIKYVEIIKNLDTTKNVRLSAVKFVEQEEENDLQNSNYSRARSPEYVNIPDENLRSLIAEKVGSTNGEVTYDQIKKLKSLSTPNNDPAKMIKSIEGLEYATNLEELDLNYNKIQDLTPLKQLKQLKILDISYNPIVNLSCIRVLSDLVYLKAIGISDNNPNFSCIAKLKNLSFLNLGVNNLKDISFVNELSNLKHLYLSFNRIQSIESLAGLPLITLAIDNNNITDFSPISNSGIANLYAYRQNVN